MAERRSLVAKLIPRESAAFEAVWDAPTIAPAGMFTLSNLNRTAHSVVGGASGARGIRAAWPMSAGSWYFELAPSHSTQANSRAGIAEASYALDSGLNMGEGGSSSLITQRGGNVYWNGAFVGAIGTVSAGNRICVHLDFDNRTLRVRRNNLSWLTVTTAIDGKGGWFPCAVEWSTSPVRTWTLYTGSLGLNFAYPVPVGASPYAATKWDPRYFWLASGRMPSGMSLGSPYELHPGRIAGDREVEIDRRVSCWPWGGGVQSSRGQLALVNPDGGLTHLLEYHWRDARIEIYRGPEGAEFKEYVLWSKGWVDRIEEVERALLLHVADPLVEMDKPLQRRMFPGSWANPQARNRPLPITIGRPRFCEGVRVGIEGTSADARSYVFHDGYRDHAATGGLTSITAAYDKGDVFAAPPTDWNCWPPTGDRRGLTLVNQPEGKIVADPVGLNVSGTVWEHLRNVCYMLWTRTAGYWDSTLSLASLDALEAAAPGAPLAAFITEPTTGLMSLTGALNGFTAWLAPRRDGTVVAGRLAEPSSVPLITLTRSNVPSRPRVFQDQARGLTTSIAIRRNHAVHGDADIGAWAPPSTGVPPEMREQLKAEWGFIRSFPAELLHPAYAHAASAPPLATWHTDVDAGWREIVRVCSLYGRLRWFVELTAFLEGGVGDAVEPGNTIRVVWPRSILSAGRNFVVVGVRSRFWTNRVDLLLWG